MLPPSCSAAHRRACTKPAKKFRRQLLSDSVGTTSGLRLSERMAETYRHAGSLDLRTRAFNNWDAHSPNNARLGFVFHVDAAPAHRRPVALDRCDVTRWATRLG